MNPNTERDERVTTNSDEERIAQIRERHERWKQEHPERMNEWGVEAVDYLLSLRDRQAAGDAPTWSKKYPTAEGYYWVRQQDHTPYVIEIESGYAFFTGIEPPTDKFSNDHEFLGPITPTTDAAARMREACVVHLQATADALDVRQETECPSGTAFNSEAALRRRIATELSSLTLDQVEREK